MVNDFLASVVYYSFYVAKCLLLRFDFIHASSISAIYDKLKYPTIASFAARLFRHDEVNR